ncbi:MAG: multidrug ABC transporter ATP-binding protein, partial [Gammaproteobacteria bacterium]
LQLSEPLTQLPAALAEYGLELSEDGMNLTYTYDTARERTGITGLLRKLSEHGIRFKDLETTQSSLEEIFVNLVRNPK